MTKIVFLVFFAKFTLTQCSIDFIILQILIKLDFAITNNKIKEIIFQIAVFDLYKNSNLEIRSLYKNF